MKLIVPERRVQAAFRIYANELITDTPPDIDRVPFIPITLETIINTLHTVGAPQIAQALCARYCDFNSIYELAMQDIHTLASQTANRADDTESTHRTGSVIAENTKAKPFARRASQSHRSTSSTRKQPVSASSKTSALTTHDISR